MYKYVPIHDIVVKYKKIYFNADKCGKIHALVFTCHGAHPRAQMFVDQKYLNQQLKIKIYLYFFEK